ncbi:MAG: hypothetical protein BMS9Abin30_1286 [Gammaproteobacteria bacterium]|nr:MAG: hypothetical protein BMS9Abin30_1286 [Gammaproteobacteria bacterium]
MQAWNSITRQVNDCLLYLLVPGLSVLLPSAWSRSLLARLSRWGWFLEKNADVAWIMARQFVDPGDERMWKSRWKQVELLEPRDLYMMLCGRSRAVLAENDCNVPIEVVKDRVIIGMHWGPSISILKLLQAAGMNPALPYRPPQKKILRIRPFYYLFLTMATRYILKTLNERAVPVGGASKGLRAMIDQPGSVIVVMDAPPMEGRPVIRSPVLGKNAAFNAGFPTILVDKRKEYMFYALSLHPDGSLRKKLELQGPFRSDNAQAFLQDYAGFLDRHLSSDPAQWRIWHAAGQFWS